MIISLSPRELPNCNILLWRPRPLTHILNIKASLTQNNRRACSGIVPSGVSGVLSQALEFIDSIEKKKCGLLVSGTFCNAPRYQRVLLLGVHAFLEAILLQKNQTETDLFSRK